MAYPGNTYRDFADLIRVESLDDGTFRSIAPPFSPGGVGGPGRAYGGHVYAQAAWAASLTVGDGYHLHNISGNFVLPGQVHAPFLYSVVKIHDGRSYRIRLVTVTQDEARRAICFICICSFKTPESSPVELQDHVQLWEKYGSVLAGVRPMDCPEVPTIDLPLSYWPKRREASTPEPFPGLQMRKVDMTLYNNEKSPLDKRQVLFYRPIGTIPIDQPNMHLCAHLYASDRDSLYHITHLMNVGDIYTQIGSLSHSVIFHSEIDDLLFGPSASDHVTKELRDDCSRWFAKEDYTTRLAGGRVMYHSWVWNSRGQHVLTPQQEGMLRFGKGETATLEELAARKGNKHQRVKGKL